MAILCPHCAAAQPITDAEVGPAGCMIQCAHCGTSWFARAYGEEPQAAGESCEVAPQADVSDAIVIEHIAPNRVGPQRAPREAPRRKAPPPRSRQQASDRQWLIKNLGGIAAVVAGVLALGAPLVAALPQLSGPGLPAAAAQLEFQRVHSETVLNRGVNTLVVEGEIVNRSGSDVAVPAIRIGLKAPSGAEVYSWLVEPTALGLGPGRTIGFRSAVAAPPAGASQVTLRLAERENQIVGLN